MAFSIDNEEAFDTIQYTCVIKTLSKLRREENFVNLIKNANENPVRNILTGESLSVYPYDWEHLSYLILYWRSSLVQ